MPYPDVLDQEAQRAGTGARSFPLAGAGLLGLSVVAAGLLLVTSTRLIGLFLVLPVGAALLYVWFRQREQTNGALTVIALAVLAVTFGLGVAMTIAERSNGHAESPLVLFPGLVGKDSPLPPPLSPGDPVAPAPAPSAGTTTPAPSNSGNNNVDGRPIEGGGDHRADQGSGGPDHHRGGPRSDFPRHEPGFPIAPGGPYGPRPGSSNLGGPNPTGHLGTNPSGANPSGNGGNSPAGNSPSGNGGDNRAGNPAAGTDPAGNNGSGTNPAGNSRSDGNPAGNPGNNPPDVAGGDNSGSGNPTVHSSDGANGADGPSNANRGIGTIPDGSSAGGNSSHDANGGSPGQAGPNDRSNNRPSESDQQRQRESQYCSLGQYKINDDGTADVCGDPDGQGHFVWRRHVQPPK